MPPATKKRSLAASSSSSSAALDAPSDAAGGTLEKSLENQQNVLAVTAAHKASLAALAASAERDGAALSSKLAAQTALVQALREENARLSARLAADGGPFRLPPAAITSSALYVQRETELEECKGALSAALAQASADSGRASLCLAALKTLTALDVVPAAGTGACVGGSLRGLFTCSTTDPVARREVAFTLDFYSEKEGDEEEASMVEFMPGVGADLLPDFLRVRAFSASAWRFSVKHANHPPFHPPHP